jgi:hypothetical protein
MLRVKGAIRATRLDDARRLALAALELDSAAEIEALLKDHGTAELERSRTSRT